MVSKKLRKAADNLMRDTVVEIERQAQKNTVDMFCLAAACVAWDGNNVPPEGLQVRVSMFKADQLLAGHTVSRSYDPELRTWTVMVKKKDPA